MIQEVNAYFDSKYEEADEEKRTDVEKARALSLGYIQYYLNDGYECLALEQRFSLPLYDIETGKPIEGVSPEFTRYAGIKDCILRKSGMVFLCDHKVLSKVDDDLWTELKTNPQLTHYWLAGRQLGIDYAGAVWDCIKKPDISPKAVTKAAKVEIENGTYCGMPVTQEYKGEEKETPHLYGLRLYSEVLEKPEKYYWRRVIQRDQDELFEYLKELKWSAQKMSAAKVDERFRSRTLSACKSFGRVCAFHAVCSGADAGKATFQAREEAPEDRRVEGITPSRLAMFQRCGREYQHHYLDKIQPIRRTYQSPLELGSMIHHALELHLKTRIAKDAETWRAQYDWFGDKEST